MSKKITEQDTSAGHLVVFQEKAIRRLWNNEEWWFSVVDVCGVLTDSPDAGAYWRKLKQRLSAEGSEVVTFCHGLKLEAPDGKQRVTDCANTEGRPDRDHSVTALANSSPRASISRYRSAD